VRNNQLAGSFLALVFALCSPAYGSDLRLRIEPVQPYPGGTVTVTYDPKGGPLDGSTTLTLVYGFDQFDSFRVGLQAKGGWLVANLPIPSNAAYSWCWVESKTADDRDTNRAVSGTPTSTARRASPSKAPGYGVRLCTTIASSLWR
jgi:hypothetical protein